MRSGSATLCEGHYNQKRRGKPFTELRPRRIEGTSCAVDGCEQERKGQYCSMHSARIARHGNPDTVIEYKDRQFPKGENHPWWTGEDATYNAIHFRLRDTRGKACEHKCFECESDASQWAYVHNRGSALTSEHGPYSVNLDDYEAMCVPCHKTMDLRLKRGST
ncbi:hypothetical protein PBI_BEAGLE_85 [Arthrobacter phage Beagle]|nr:hypothetical protein PBI_BEAGLE_85 [Arthrobacter phage Beagle]